jgi:hypothetical protein
MFQPKLNAHRVNTKIGVMQMENIYNLIGE